MKKALGPVTLAYPMPAFLVAAYDEEGKANIMTSYAEMLEEQIS